MREEFAYIWDLENILSTWKEVINYFVIFEIKACGFTANLVGSTINSDLGKVIKEGSVINKLPECKSHHCKLREHHSQNVASFFASFLTSVGQEESA